MKLHFLIPGNINALTGGNLYDKQLMDGMSERGYKIILHVLSQRFPFPLKEDIESCSGIFQVHG